MDGLWAAWAAALTLGATHALELDHMVAISTFVGGRPQLKPALGFGVRWGLGHGAAVFLTGGLLVWSGLRVPESAAPWAEAAIGIMLIALGGWAVRRTRGLHVHDPVAHGGAEHAHVHLHAHPPGRHPHTHAHRSPDRRHRHLSTLIGAAHGLAGSAPAVALLPVTLMENRLAAVGYLAVFGIGTAAAMGGYAVLAALAVRRAAGSLRAARAVAFTTAGASVLVGAAWLGRALLA